MPLEQSDAERGRSLLAQAFKQSDILERNDEYQFSPQLGLTNTY
jgi:hypothetical protein